MNQRNILIVNVNWIGDVIFSTPFINTVRRNYPESRIACLLHPRCFEVLKGNPRIDEIIIYDEEGVHKSLIGKLKLIASLRKRGFDIAFMLHRSFTKALMVFLSGARERVGYPTKSRGIFLTMPVEIPDEEVHKVEYFLNLARAYGMDLPEVSYEFFITDADRRRIRDLLNESGIGDKDLLAILCPGGNWDPKRWPKEDFARLADMIIERLGAKVVISGARKDIALAGTIKGIMKNGPVILCGSTDLKGLGALMERSNLVVANDTGPMHIAVAMNANVIALFGPTSPKLTGPYGRGNYRIISKNEECEVPCYDLTCTDNRCMSLITVEEVFNAAKEMLSRKTKNDKR